MTVPMIEQALLIAALVDSTQLVERLGDIRGARIRVEHDRQAPAPLSGCGGREIDRADGIFQRFAAAADAARFALGYDDMLAAHHALGQRAQARADLELGLARLRAKVAET